MTPGMIDIAGLRKAFNQTLGMRAANRDGVLTVCVSASAVGDDWTLIWHSGQGDMCWDHGLNRTKNGFSYWDPETVLRPLTCKEALAMLNAPFDSGDTGRGLEAHGCGQAAGMLRLALALDDAARLPGPGVPVALPFRLVWEL